MYSFRDKLSYSFLGVAIGFMSLPLYVYLPKFYTENFGLSLIVLSLILFLTRIIDTIQDPVIGWLSDRLVSRKTASRHAIVLMSLPFLAFSFLGLLFPVGGLAVYISIIFFFIMAYTFLSFMMVNYYTLSAELTQDYNEQTILVSSREAMTLLGIAIGSIIPPFFERYFSVEATHFLIWLVFVAFTIVGAVFFINSPRPQKTVKSRENLFKAMRVVIHNTLYIRLAVVYLLSMIAASFPATIVLFYIQDVLHLNVYAGIFLLTYFVSAFCGIPFWIWVSARYTKKKAWMAGMILTVVGFLIAGFLGEGQLWLFVLSCLITGFSLSADLTMPMSLLADILIENEHKAKFYGIWGMLTKSSFALAGSFALLVLYFFGYTPGKQVTDVARMLLAVTYAFVPCLIKLCSLYLLWRADVDVSYEEA